MRLTIDDVGAGFSSLRHIVTDCPDVLGMDRSTVSGIDSDPVLAELAQSLAGFAHSFDVSVVAESVETAAEHAVLQFLGVDGGQGWLLGRPAPADVLVDAGTVLAPQPPDDTLRAPSIGSRGPSACVRGQPALRASSVG